MATKKKNVKVRDMKPSKDAKGGASLNRGARQQGATGKQGAKKTKDLVMNY